MHSLVFHSSLGYTLEFNLIEHFTLILGEFSGEGKTWCFEYLQEHLNVVADEEAISIDSTLPVRFCNSFKDLADNLELEHRSILIMDEITFTLSAEIMRQLNNTKHLMICIARSMPYGYNCSIKSIYRVYYSFDWFSCELLSSNSSLRMIREFDPSVNFDYIITESEQDKSENLLISTWCQKVTVIAACGRNNICRKIESLPKDSKILVMMDLANFASLYEIMNSTFREYSNAWLFDYMSFEEMLFHSRFINGFVNLDQYDYMTLERYYEDAIHVSKFGKPWYCSHSTVSECCLKECGKLPLCKAGCEKNCGNKFLEIVGGNSILIQFFRKANKSLSRMNAF